MLLDERFANAVNDIRTLKSMPNEADKLEIYGLFKQATVGDVDDARPGVFDVKGKAKWDAWCSKNGLTRDEAKEQYIAKVRSLLGQ